MAFINHQRHINGQAVDGRLDLGMNPIIKNGDGLQFRLKSLLMVTRNSTIFHASQLDEKRIEFTECIVKFLRQLDDVRMDRFENESQIMSRLNHERIARLFGAGHEFDRISNVHVPWLAMSRGGPNLRAYVEDHGPIQPDRLGTLLCDMMDAIGHVHGQGIIHRDIKPDNFVVDGGPGQERLTMIDFGIAKPTGVDVAGRPMDEFTKSAEFVGPVFYFSPELIAYGRDKNQKVDHRSDLFQMGRVLWFAATGSVSSGVPSKKKDPTGGQLFELVFRLVQDDPADRFATVQEVREAAKGFI
jgi:eukaryotic-like serine/threonine-protein kinase